MTTLNETELNQLAGMRAQAELDQIGYWQIYQWLGDLLVSKGVASTGSSLLWLRGATEANAGRGAMSELIRAYTDTQYQLRYGTGIPAGKMQEASNAVAENLIKDLLGLSDDGWPRGQVPDIARIAFGDAKAVGRVLFGPESGKDPGDTAFLQNSAWSGTLLFSLLRSDQTAKLISTATTTAIDTLNDWRDVLYAAAAYAKALPAANAAYWSGSLAQKTTDMAVMGTTIISYFNSGHTTADVWNTVLSGASNGMVGNAFTLIGDVGQNKFWTCSWERPSEKVCWEAQPTRTSPAKRPPSSTPMARPCKPSARN